MTAWFLGIAGLLLFFCYPDRIGRTFGFVIFVVAALAFWTNIITNGV